MFHMKHLRSDMLETYFEKKLTEQVPIPVCVVDRKGKIIDTNSRMEEVFPYDEIKDYDFFALVGVKIEDLLATRETGEAETVARNGKVFRLYVKESPDEDNANLFVYFFDITAQEEAKDTAVRQRICVARVDIDNYDEMKASMDPELRMTTWSQADRAIRQWAAKIEGSVVSISSSEYIIYYEHRYSDDIIRSKFEILDEIRKIETDLDFPMSLSIGIGIGGKNIRETRQFADGALDLAQGRGGDQAVVRRGSKIEHFGGILQSVEKRNKGKSRVIAHALARLIDQADRIMIMGHRNPDMDAFGSALGMYRVCLMKGQPASIVLQEPNDSLQAFYRNVLEKDTYNIISHERALELADENTLVVVLDTHRPSYVECPQLLEKTDKVAVIDHHRRAVDAIQEPVLSYIESYASSTAELIAEILQYSGQRKQVDKLEAEALLAGMTVDTNRFAMKTGVRTFEAAAWLRRAGADTTEVKRFFQLKLDDFKARARALADAKITEDGIAMSVLEGFNEEAQIINSQVADELLNVRGMRASFVAGRDGTGQTVVSARSLGDINVQLIMEKLGGGGHLTTAGAQVEDSPEEVIEMIRDLLSASKTQ